MTIALSLLGIFIGFASGFFGIGGGTLLVPILIYLGFGIKAAIGISVMQMVFSSIFGSYVNFKHGMLKLDDGIFLGLGGFSGALLSGFIVKLMPDWVLMVVFASSLVMAMYKFFKAPASPSGPANESRLLLYLVGVFVGSTAISIGIGGALLLTPIMVGFLNYDIKRAVSTGLFFVVFSSISGFISMSYNGLIDYTSGLALGFGSLLGVYFGAKQSHIIDKAKQKKLLLGLYLVLFILTVNKLLG